MKQYIEREKRLQELLESVGEKIKARRLKKGITQLDLADIVGCNQDNISRIETGKNNLTLEYLFKIADSLGVTIGYFFK
jgi:transcriptional regulator with XRE-family HTH domain